MYAEILSAFTHYPQSLFVQAAGKAAAKKAA